MTISLPSFLTSGVSHSPSIAGLAGLLATPDYAGLSDESILAMLQSRMNDLDGQISSVTRQLESATAEASRIGGEIQKLAALREVADAHHGSDGQYDMGKDLSEAEINRICDAFGIDRSSIPGGEDGVIVLGDVFANVEVNGTNLSTVQTTTGMQSFSESLNEELRQCNSGNEQAMVKLQSVMQQRTQVVQMCSNMMKANDEARDGVVGNLR